MNRIYSALLACGLCLMTACSSSSRAAPEPPSVTIGVLAPLSGSLKTVGESMQVAIDQGLPQVNRRLALEGKNFRVKTLIMDTASDPQTAQYALNALKSEGVSIVIGPVSSAECEAVRALATSLDMILVSPGSTASSLAIADDNLYRLLPDDSNQGAATAALMLKKGFSAVVPIWRGDVWGDGLKRSTCDAFQTAGGTVLAGARFSPDASRLSSELDAAATQVSQAVKTYGAGKVAVLMVSYPGESVTLLSGAATRPDLAKANWFGSDASTLSPLVTASPEASSFAVQCNLMSPIFSRDDAALPLKGVVLNDRALRDRISIALGRTAETTAYCTWDALWLASRAYAESGDLKTTAALKTALVNAAFSNVGLSGALVFNAAGDKKNFNYAFYKISAATSGSYAWTLKAAYQGELMVTPQIVEVTDPVLKGFTPPASTVTIGALLSLTGGQTTNGKSVKAGLQAALVDVNRYLTWHGYPVQIALEVVDTGTDPARALAAFKTLADKGIQFMVGPLSSAECEQVLPAANNRGVILVSPTSNAIQLAKPDDNLIRFVPSGSHEAAAIALYLHEQGITSMATLTRNDVWGIDLSNQVATEFKALGGTVIGSATYAVDATRYTSALTAISNVVDAAQDAHTAVLCLSFDEITDIFLQASAFPSLAKVKWHGGDASSQNERLAATPTAAAFAEATGFTCPIEHVFVSHAPQKSSVPKLVFRDEIRETHGGTPALCAFPSWDALWTIVSTLTGTEWSTDPAVLRSAVVSGSSGYIGMSNFMALDENGDRKYGDYVFFTLTPSTSGYLWNNVATYHFHPVLYLTPKITYP